MATHDYVLANQSGSSFRSDLNNALAAIVSQNSNATEPATTYAYQYWVDTSATPALVKQRNAANDAWVTLAEVDGQTLAADGTNAKPGIAFAADINTGLKRNAADDVSIVTGGTQAITVDSSQNVGIGTASPSSALHLSSSAPVFTITDTDTNAIHTINADSSGGNVSFNVDTTEIGDTNSKSSFIINTHGEERLRVQGGTGNVGIGTNSPDTLLHLASDQGGAEGRIKFDCDVSSGYDVKVESTDIGLEVTAQSNTRSIRLLTGSTPSEGFRVFGDGQVRMPHVYNDTTATGANMTILTDGKVRRSTSSSRYKTAIETIDPSYSHALLDLRPIYYRSLSEVDSPEHSYWGFTAEEVHEIDPRLVQYKTTELVADENGELVSQPCDPVPDGVDYARFVPHLLLLIKEQKQAIQVLEEKVAALEAAN